MISLALYQPDIAQNVGTLLRLCAGLGMPAHIIEPCGFPFDDKRLRRAGMDYLDHVTLTRHTTWECFLAQRAILKPRLILLSTKATTAYTDFSFQPNDMLLVGRESAGVPDAVRDAADISLLIPLAPPARSLNVATAAAMVVGEALRQTQLFPV